MRLESRLVVARQVTMAGLSKGNLTHNRTCIKDICTETILSLPQMRFPVLVNWHCALCHANQPKIQKLEETWCVKITSNSISFPQSHFYIHCHLKILSLTKTAILIVKLSGCQYLFGHKKSGQKCCVTVFTGFPI